MKSVLAAALMFSSIATPVLAGMPYAPAPAMASRYTCEGRALSRVSLPAEPAPCCVGMLGCPQLLANTGLAKPKASGRT